MKKVYLLSITFLLILISFQSCYKDKAQKLYPTVAACDTANITYTNSVKSILDANCVNAGCHNNNNPSGGYLLDNYNNTLLAIPNNKLINALKYVSGGSKNMPPSGKISECEINKIQAWINQGSKN